MSGRGRVERLRVWLLVGVGLLVAVIAAFLGYAHYRANKFIKDLPGKLGADIRRESNGVTYSQSVGGKTIYTIHAASAVEHADGKTTLHDVGIVLYGRKQDRTDRIYGSEFEYDQKAEVVRAMGEVHIDLQGPVAADAKSRAEYAAGKGGHEHGGKETPGGGLSDGLIHVKTSGLVFLQKLGVAATDKDIEFSSGGLTGHAVGADYSSDTGVLVLHAGVRVNGLQGGRPIVLTAARAELDRLNKRVLLRSARYVAVGGKGAQSEGEIAEAQEVTVHLKADGSPERVEAVGGVTFRDGSGGTVTAERGEGVLSGQNRLKTARLVGAVKYGADESLREVQGEAAEGNAMFDAAGRPARLVLTGAAHLKERQRAAASAPWSERELGAGELELTLATDGAKKVRLQDAKATGDARLSVMDEVLKNGKVSTRSSEAKGEVLTAKFVRVGGVDRVSSVHGAGHAMLRRVGEGGAEDSSSGDSLEMAFVTGKAVGKSTVTGAEQVSSAVQDGHVAMLHRVAAKAGAKSGAMEERATAQKALYDGAAERLTLTGRVQVNDAGSVLWADRVVMNRVSGDATADGAVKVSYEQTDGAEPVHVLAGRAELKHDAGQAYFYASGGKLARMWQGGTQVEAPVLQLEQKTKRLVAKGDGQGSSGAVHAVLVSAESKPGTGDNAAKSGAAGKKTRVVRVVSREMVYLDEARRVELSGGVKVESADGVMRGRLAMVYLKSSESAKNVGVAGAFPSGSVERIVATGEIEIEQPGRQASGEQVVYTAGDGMFVMTGTAAIPPKVVDEVRGVVSGSTLRFHAGDESVLISNDGSSAGRVRTETRVKQ